MCVWCVLKEKFVPTFLAGSDLSLSSRVMDEFALRKSHRYDSVTLAAETKRELWISLGRRLAWLHQPCFESLGRQGCRRIEARARDLTATLTSMCDIVALGT